MKIETIIKTEAAMGWVKLVFVAVLLATFLQVITKHDCENNSRVKAAMQDSTALLKMYRSQYLKCNGQIIAIENSFLYQHYLSNSTTYPKTK